MSIFRHSNSALEKDFIMVYWDERGAGKSYSPFINKDTMNINQLVDDTIALSKYLKNRFGKSKIFLLGHSFGSIIGAKAAFKNPELYYAYIGEGQMINVKENGALTYQWAIEKAKENNDNEAIAKLKSIEGFINEDSMDKDGVLINGEYIQKYGGYVYGQSNINNLYNIKAKEENAFDLITFILGVYFSQDTLWDDICSIEMDKEIDTFEIPVFFIQGREDNCCVDSLLKKYYSSLKAPYKEIIWFDKSAHYPNFEEPEKFDKTLVNIKNKLLSE